MNLDPIILAELQRGGPPLWASGRTYLSGTVVRSPANWQPYVRTASGAGAQDPSADGANWLRWNKSIEDAIATVNNAVAAVANQLATTDGKVVTVSGQVTGVANAVAALQGTANTINAKGIKSVQRGVTAIVASTGVSTVGVAIAAVNPTKCEVRCLGVRSPGLTLGGLGTVELASPTQLIVTAHPPGGATLYLSWEITEWN